MLRKIVDRVSAVLPASARGGLAGLPPPRENGPVPGHLSDSRLANLGARAVRDAWAGFADRFRIITRRARLRFEAGDWKGMRSDHVERLELYSSVARETAATVAGILGEKVEDRMVWAAMKAVYSGLIEERTDWDVAETFFNSVTRKIFSTVGVDPHIEFVDTDFDDPPAVPPEPVVRTYRGGDTAALVRGILLGAGFTTPFVDLSRDAEAVAARIDARLSRLGSSPRVDRIDLVDPVFFRGKGAYLIGRIHAGRDAVPFAIALLRPPEGIVVDAVLLTENELSILFSFTRSYFHVDVRSPHTLVNFLSSLMPRKRRAELYMALGHNKHGKTELYRELRRHLAASTDTFEIAAGTRGLVMVVFTLPGFDVVFKVIKDRFGVPKQVTRAQVLNRYRLVFRHDRAGRLVDAQEYEHLQFPKSRFTPELLDLLGRECARTVHVLDGEVAIEHAYVERRVTPLDVFLADASPADAERVILEYGQAIKDLAAGGIFPGDLLLKNFGVTRHGRVVFYDYDELTSLSECRFRRLPPAPTYDEELADEPWFAVGPHDVFPEELPHFLGLPEDLRSLLLSKHPELFDVDAWIGWQERVEAGDIIEVYPYGPEARIVSG